MRKKTSENIAGRFMPGSLEYTTLWLVQSEPGQISSFATLVFTTLVEKTIKCITQNMERKKLLRPLALTNITSAVKIAALAF